MNVCSDIELDVAQNVLQIHKRDHSHILISSAETDHTQNSDGYLNSEIIGINANPEGNG